MKNKKTGGQREKKALPPFSIMLNIVGILIIAAILVIGAAGTVPKLMGKQIYNVSTGSMEPEIPVGSMILVSPWEPAELEPGDIITFTRNSPDPNGAGIEARSDTVTHRIVKNDRSACEIITKGDANEQEDIAPVPYSNVAGKVTAHIAGLGAMLTISGSLYGKIGLICAALLGFLLTFIAGKLRS